MTIVVTNCTEKKHKSQFLFSNLKISCNLRVYVILVILVIIVIITRNHSHQSYHGINAQSCYWGPVCPQKVGWIVIGHYGYKSSFGAKNDRPGDDGTLRSV